MARKPVKTAGKPAARGKRRAGKSRKARGHDPEATVSALIILAVIAIVMGGGYLYQRNKAPDAAPAAPAAGLMEKK
jgi:hypothetical protein